MEDRDEERLQSLRDRLFNYDWSSGEFKAMIRDEVPSEIYSESHGFKLFLGSCDHAADLSDLDQRGVTYIINMAASEASCQMTPEVYGDSYTCLRIAAADNIHYNISQHFEETAEFIEEARRKGTGILVHCAAGASRSASIVMAYLMQNWTLYIIFSWVETIWGFLLVFPNRHGWSLEKAATHVRSKRARTYPNNGFLRHLTELDRKQAKQKETKCVTS